MIELMITIGVVEVMSAIAVPIFSSIIKKSTGLRLKSMIFGVFFQDVNSVFNGAGGIMENNREQCLGFTLIELMVIVSVVGVLSAIAVPSFTSIIKNGRLATETNDLMVDLAFARAEAARLGKRVSLCVSSDGVACSKATAWAGGRIVFSDTGTYGVVDTGDEILRVNKSITTNNVTISASGFTVSSTSTLDFIQFKPSGATNSDAGGFFTICDNRSGNFGRRLEVSMTGRTSLTSTTTNCP